MFVFLRAAVLLRGGGVDQAALQEPPGGHGAQRLPVPEEAGGAADQAHRRDAGHAAGDAGGHDHRSAGRGRACVGVFIYLFWVFFFTLKRTCLYW